MPGRSRHARLRKRKIGFLTESDDGADRHVAGCLTSNRRNSCISSDSIDDDYDNNDDNSDDNDKSNMKSLCCYNT